MSLDPPASRNLHSASVKPSAAAPIRAATVSTKALHDVVCRLRNRRVRYERAGAGVDCQMEALGRILTLERDVRGMRAISYSERTSRASLILRKRHSGVGPRCNIRKHELISLAKSGHRPGISG